ncbi:MAG TPA: ubiquinol-cytochrome c reductase iron-sulfur subunit [Candidatus Binataceae bacterium]|nr:ubiquinol-cytochrome c reductase iron-sulfur subunit [Candidatus Binataceae bacterium]
MATETPPPSNEALSPERRVFITKVSMVAMGLVSLLVAVPIVGFLIGPLVRRFPDVWRSVGSVDSFKIGQTVKVSFRDPSPLAWAGVTAETAAWLRRISANEFMAFAMNCTHLGCPVRWLPDANLFMCPCHGGVYYSDGRVAGGPPPRALFTYPVRINNGLVEIQTSAIPIG